MNYELLADEVLLRLLRNSEVKAFEAIFERYWERIFYSAYKKLRSKEIAEDLTQNLFASLWEKRTVFQVEDLFRYLSVGIKNRVINHVNAELIKDKYKQTTASPSLIESDTDQQLMLKDLQNTIELALYHLPDKSRAIFKLSKFEKRSVKEIANLFNLTEKAVEYHITLSNKVLRPYLKELFILDILLFFIV